MSWGYRHGTAGIDVELQRNKQLIRINELGTKIYKSSIGDGYYNTTTIFWHDNRNTGLNSHLIIKNIMQSKHFDITNLRTQKEIFKFAEKLINEYKL